MITDSNCVSLGYVDLEKGQWLSDQFGDTEAKVEKRIKALKKLKSDNGHVHLPMICEYAIWPNVVFFKNFHNAVAFWLRWGS